MPLLPVVVDVEKDTSYGDQDAMSAVLVVVLVHQLLTAASVQVDTQWIDTVTSAAETLRRPSSYPSYPQL